MGVVVAALDVAVAALVVHGLHLLQRAIDRNGAFFEKGERETGGVRGRLIELVATIDFGHIPAGKGMHPHG